MLVSLDDLHNVVYDCCLIFALSALCYVGVVVSTSLCTITSGVDGGGGDDNDHTSVHLLLLITR
jgi:hypothetical protein